MAVFTAETAAAQKQIVSPDSALATLKRPATTAARRRRAELRERREQLLAQAEAMEFKAYARFETTLEEFTPRLLAMMSAEDAAIDGVGEAEVADFWECWQRPWLE